MEQKLIAAVNRQVYQKYPEVRDAAPKVKAQTNGTYLFLYESTVKTSDGRSMKRAVRASVSESGKITKLTASK